MRTRLRRRFPAPVVEKVIKSLKEQGLVDDAKFAMLWKNSRESFKPRSAWAVKRELIAKGVDSGLADETVREIDDEESAYRAALDSIRRVEGVGFASFHRRLRGFLQRRGFSERVCRRTISRLWDERGQESSVRSQEKS